MKTTSLVKNPDIPAQASSTSAKCTICNGDKNKFIGFPSIPQKFIGYIRKEYKSFYCKECNYYFVWPGIDLTEKEWSNMYKEGYFPGTMTKWWRNKRSKERKRVINYFKKYSPKIYVWNKKNFKKRWIIIFGST